MVAAIDRAVGDRRLPTVDGAVVWLQAVADAPDEMAGVLRQAHGGCVFHLPDTAAPRPAPSAGRHCGVQSALGHEALPGTCQHFPRVCLIDDRGVRVTLSHACPTAATMLVDHDGPVAIVPGPPAVPGLAMPEGLDARGQLPPRLGPCVLMDLDGLTAWEAHVVGALAGPGASSGSAEAVLDRLRVQARRLTSWTPGRTSMAEAVRALDGRDDDDPVASRVPTGRAALALVAAACRPPWTPDEPPSDLDALDARFVAPQWSLVAGVARRYLAARAFGAWVTYHADGARALVAWLDLSLAVLRVACARGCGAAGRPLDRALVRGAVGDADRWLLHDADAAVLARALADP